MLPRRLVRSAFSLLVGLAAIGPSPLHAQAIDAEHFGELKFRHIGPVGNRVSTVVGVPGDPMTYYGGAASGGVWKTEDGGLSWRPVFDDQPVHSIGALAVAPSDHNVVWVGTGESFIRSNVSIGTGVYRSTDAGETWQHMGLDNTGRVSRVIIHPSDPNRVYVAALGHGYAPQPERGIYRTTDGGSTWEQVLFVDENTGASDLAMDPNNPRILIAGMWQIDIKTWTRESGGPGSGLFMSKDGGDTWNRLVGRGLPKLPVGKVAVCMTPENSDRIYSLIETGDGVPWRGDSTESGELWRSDDGGGSWQLVSHNRDLAGRSAYYSRCAASPDDHDEVYFLSASYSISTDGGKTTQAANFFNPTGPSAPGWDHHDMWIDPTDGDRMIAGHDGGVSISENRGKSWLRVQLPVAQMYHVTVDTKIPYNVMGNRQDGPAMHGPSNSRLGSLLGSGIPRAMWHDVGGGESGFATPDPVDPDIVWSSASGAGAAGGIVVRHDERTRQFRQVEVWPEGTFGWPAADLKYRFQWTFPLLISPHDHNTVYVTSQHVHRTTNAGQTWEVISPDLTTNDKSKQGVSGGLTPDNLGVEFCCVIYAFDESPVQAGVFWAGTNDGLVHVSRDGGTTWTNVTDNIRNLPPLGTVRNIDASKWDAGTAYVTIDFHQVGNFDPHVYKTNDYGESWTKITDGVADSPLSYARFVHEDPVRPGLLYLGTENALYVSFDDGDTWQSLQNNLPATPVYGLVVQEHFNDLVVGTYGRGFWILDDITPLQQMTAEVARAPVHLFRPRDAYRFQPVTAPMTMFDDPSAGDNPPYGASINYRLADSTESEVKVRIFNAAGDTVRTLDGTKNIGVNRVWWNLQGEQTTEIKLRTKPLYADWVGLGDDRWRPAPQGRFSMLVPPGTYTVTLAVGDEEYSQQLRVLKDPNTAGSEADIIAQTEVLRALWGDMHQAADAVNRIEWLRRQLFDLQAVVEEQEDGDEIVTASQELHDKLLAVEEKLIQLRQTGTGQDAVRWPAKLVGRIGYLAGSVAIGDFAPTDSEREVQTILKERLTTYLQELEQLVRSDVDAFNTMLRERNMSQLISRRE